ncbi:MAG: FmdB family zinc ribbon protein [Thermodesulfobacteriota bacterium]
MPIYEYQCQSCRQVTEKLQKISDAPLRKCPECGGRMSKLMSMNTFHLKGSGWYVTDYSKGGRTGPGDGAEKKDNSAKKETASSQDSTPKKTDD